MRTSFIWLLAALFLISCNQKYNEADAQGTEAATVASQDFFPVTNFIKGEILDIRTNGVNPMKITTTGSKVDSGWLKVEELDSAFAEFLHPEIDSSTMGKYFKETKFLDQTINAYTFTYEPKVALPDSLSIQRWDVHINPQAKTVKRIYIEKINDQNRQLRLTWQSKESCTIISFSPNDTIEKEVLIKWKFE